MMEQEREDPQRKAGREFWGRAHPMGHEVVVELWDEQRTRELQGEQLYRVRQRFPTTHRATVLAIGPRVVDVRVGDHVLIPARYPDQQPNAKLLCMPIDEVVAVLSDLS